MWATCLNKIETFTTCSVLWLRQLSHVMLEASSQLLVVKAHLLGRTIVVPTIGCSFFIRLWADERYQGWTEITHKPHCFSTVSRPGRLVTVKVSWRSCDWRASPADWTNLLKEEQAVWREGVCVLQNEPTSVDTDSVAQSVSPLGPAWTSPCLCGRRRPCSAWACCWWVCPGLTY